MERPQLVRAVMAIIITMMLSATLMTTRDHQDLWVLADIELPYLLFLSVFVLYFLVEKNMSWLLAIALVARLTLLAIPNLKYVWFQGIAIDQHQAYRLTLDIYETEALVAGDLYSGTPFMHLLFAIFSKVTQLDVVHAFKIVPLIPWLAFPILTYCLVKTTFPANPTLQKYAILFSVIPFKGSIAYTVLGQLFPPLLIFTILYLVIKNYQHYDRSSTLLIVLFSFFLAGLHSFSSIAFSMILVLMTLLFMLIQKDQLPFISLKLRQALGLLQDRVQPVSSRLTFIFVVISVTWFIYVSTASGPALHGIFSFLLSALGLIDTNYPGFIPDRFFAMGFLNQLRFVLLQFGADLFVLGMTLLALIILYRSRRFTQPLFMILAGYIAALILFFIFGGIFNIGWQWLERTLRMAVIITPLFVAFSLFRIRQRIHRSIPPILIIIFLMLTTLQFYNYQPLMPPASSFDSTLPDDEPIYYINSVNSIYQREMMRFAERTLPETAGIATDMITYNQLQGLTSREFALQYVYYYPLSDAPPRDYDYFLIHRPGKSGILGDKAETRTTDVILSAVNASNIIFSNGESYILTDP